MFLGLAATVVLGGRVRSRTSGFDTRYLQRLGLGTAILIAASAVSLLDWSTGLDNAGARTIGLLERAWCLGLPAVLVGIAYSLWHRRGVHPYRVGLVLVFSGLHVGVSTGFGLQLVFEGWYGPGTISQRLYALGALCLLGFLVVWLGVVGREGIAQARQILARSRVGGPEVPRGLVSYFRGALGAWVLVLASTILWVGGHFTWSDSFVNLLFVPSGAASAGLASGVARLLLFAGILVYLGVHAWNPAMAHLVPHDLYFIFFMSERGGLLYFNQFRNPDPAENPAVADEVFAHALPSFSGLIREGTGIHRGQLRKIALDRYEVIVQTRGVFLCALVCERETYALRKILARVTNDVQDFILSRLLVSRKPLSAEEGPVIERVIKRYMPHVQFMAERGGTFLE